MTIGERIRFVRKVTKQTQAEFGEKIGLKQSSLGQIESSTRNATDRTILLICEKFNVSESWLRSGNGEMFLENDSTILHDLQEQYNLDDFGVRFMEAFLKLTPEQREVIKNFAHAIVATREDTISNSDSTIDDLEAEYKKMLSGLASSRESSASNITDENISTQTSEG